MTYLPIPFENVRRKTSASGDASGDTAPRNVWGHCPRGNAWGRCATVAGKRGSEPGWPLPLQPLARAAASARRWVEQLSDRFFSLAGQPTAIDSACSRIASAWFPSPSKGPQVVLRETLKKSHPRVASCCVPTVVLQGYSVLCPHCRTAGEDSGIAKLDRFWSSARSAEAVAQAGYQGHCDRDALVTAD